MNAQLTMQPGSVLTQAELEFVHNVEVLGLPAKKAATLAGVSIGLATKPHIQQAREIVRKEMLGVLNISKEDVVRGMHDAVGRAKILSEPMTEIIGWEKIAKLLGYDTPQKIDINIHASVQVMKDHVRNLPDEELVKLLGAGNIIDGDFYRVGQTEDHKTD